MTFDVRYCDEIAGPANALKLFAGSWKYDFEKLSPEEIEKVVLRDGRPGFCESAFGNLVDMSILETGPGDGYLSAGLERRGASNILSIEAGSEAFMRCLVFKNYNQLKTNYQYGDFVRYIAGTEITFDLIFSAGILYHLVDPVGFIRNCSRVSPRLFLWTFYYDEAAIREHRYESRWFRHEEGLRVNVSGAEYAYHKRVYERAIVDSSRYTGGLFGFAHWLTRSDLLRALENHGYEILKTVEDDHDGVPAINICAQLK